MANAFASFDEAHAWLIRGLVEYGWPDITHAGGRVPPGVFGGIDLSRLADSQGREGVFLEVRAVADGRTCDEDGTYTFQVQVTQGREGLAISVRCPEANYLQEFPYDPANPIHAAGWVHQAITQYVPDFVRWRLSGGEVSWAQRSGMPTVDGEPCSPALAQFVRGRIDAHRRFDVGPSEGWWLDEAQPAAPAGVVPASAWQGPIAVEGQAGRVGSVDDERDRAMRIVKAPAAALRAMSIAGMAFGFFWFVNIVVTLYFFGLDRLGAVLFSLVAGTLLLMTAGIAFWCAGKYKDLAKGPLPWVAIAWCALVPLCCIPGIPVAIWAAWAWTRPAVQRSLT